MSTRNFARTLQDRGLPPEPPAENPHELASAQWQKLHDYATKLAAITAEVDDENKTLRAENASLHSEIDRLTALNADIAREHRTTIAYAEGLRTRIKAIREGLEAAEREALQYAAQDVHERKPLTSEEQREVEEVVASIARINARDTDQHRTTPPSLSWSDRDLSSLPKTSMRHLGD